MSKKYERPVGERLALAERLFDALGTMRELTRPPEDGDAGPGTVAFSALYAYATDPEAPPDERIETALRDDPGLMADFRRLLEKTAARRLPRVAAASSGAIMSREGEGCRIRFRASHAEPSQTYIIIELTDEPAEGPNTLFIVYPDKGCRRFSLPPARDRVIQVLAEEDSDLLQGLLDIRTEVFLR